MWGDVGRCGEIAHLEEEGDNVIMRLARGVMKGRGPLGVLRSHEILVRAAKC